jgi:hypothetical protein
MGVPMKAVFALIVFAACTTEPIGSNEAEVVAHKKKHKTVTVIRQNGLNSDTLLNDPNTGTNGFLQVSRDELNNTTAIDFSYATPTSDPILILITQGAGTIPNSAYTQTDTVAHLTLATTPFPLTRCTVNTDTGEFTCVTGGPSIAWNLTWQANGFQIIEQFTRRKEILGPLTTKFKGDFTERSAVINGTWNGNTAVNLSGHLTDTQGTTITREITMEMN